MAASSTTPEFERAHNSLKINLPCIECDTFCSTYCPSCPSEHPCCEACFSITHGTPKKKSHQLKSLKEKVSFNCPEHEEKLRLYCLVDQNLMCSVCCYGTHKGHEALPVNDAVEKLRGEVAYSLESVISARQETASQLQKYEQKIAALKKQLQQLDTSFEKLSLCLDEQNPSLFLLSWVEAVQLSRSFILLPNPSKLLSESDWKVSLYSTPIQSIPQTRRGPPRLLNPDYSTRPSMSKLQKKSDDKLSRIKNFTVIHEGIARVCWPGHTDVRGLDLTSLVIFHPPPKQAIEVYPPGTAKPEVGQGLNKLARLTLEGIILPKSEKRKQKYLQVMLSQKNAIFDNGVWEFEVDHFSRYGLPGFDDDDSGEER